jgi:DNA-binding transcriptional LysR family regulator
MEIRWMQTFIAVAEELHFGHAAERLHIAQPAVSQQIQNLEADLGVQLFRRDKRSVSLTPAGEAFLQPCLDALQAIDTATLKARNSSDGATGLVRIGFSAWLTADYLTILTALLAKKYPGIKYKIASSQTSDDMQHGIRDSLIDIGVVGGPILDEKLGKMPIREERLGVVVPEGHRLADATEVSFGMLREVPFILLPSTPGFSVRTQVEAGCRENGFIPGSVTEISDGLSVNLLNVNGAGLSFLGSGAQSFITSAQRFKPLTEPVKNFPTSVIWKPSNLTPTLATVLSVCDEAVAIYNKTAK